MKEKEFVWLELRPQQNSKDEKENSALEIIRYAREFAFFVFRKEGRMQIVVRTSAEEQNIYRTIDGISATRCERPDFDNLIAKSLAFKGSSFMMSLADQRPATKSNLYQKLWKEDSDCMMACFAYGNTKQALGKINARIRSLEGQEKSKGLPLSGRKKQELAHAIQRRDCHQGHYNCKVIFGTYCGTKGVTDKKQIEKSLDMLIGQMLPNSFVHNISRRKTKISCRRQSLQQRLVGLVHPVKTIDPCTYVPTRMRSSMVLTESELAYFVSFPQEHDIQTINFEMGPNPTFMHGSTEDIAYTDLDIQNNSKLHLGKDEN